MKRVVPSSTVLLLALSLMGCGSSGSQNFEVPVLPPTPVTPVVTPTVVPPRPDLSPSPTPTRVPDEEARAATTVLVFMNGSNLEDVDLGSNGSDNLAGMLRSQGSSQVNVVVTTGGCDKVSPGALVSSWKTVKRHLVQPGKLTELSDLGPLNMDDPATLRDFLVWGERNYPARRFLVVMWDHGAGYAGFGGDKNQQARTGQRSIMRQPEMVGAFREAQAITGRRIDMLGFDACLMACDEVASAVQPFADTLVASEEKEPSSGWDYSVWLNALAAQPDLPAAQLGRLICDSFLARCRALKRDEVTLSVLDLAGYESVRQALRSFAAAVEQELRRDPDQSLRTLTLARDRGLELERKRSGARPSRGDTVDLQSWMDQLIALNFVAEQAAAVKAAVTSVVSYHVEDDQRNEATGLSVFFPSDWQQASTRQVYSETVGVTLKDFVLSCYDLIAARISRIEVTALQLSADLTQLQGSLQSIYGLSQAALVLSPDGPEVDMPEVAVSGALPVPPDASGRLNFSVPLPNQVLLWDGRRLPLTPENAESLEIACSINGEPSTLRLRRTADGFEPESYFSNTEFRDVELDADDLIAFPRQVFNRAQGTVEINNRERALSFQAGEGRITLGPLQGNFFVYFLARDLFNRQVLSSQRVELTGR